METTHQYARAVDYSPYSIKPMETGSKQTLDFQMEVPLPYGPFTPPAEADMVVLARGERNPHWEAGTPRYIAGSGLRSPPSPRRGPPIGSGPRRVFYLRLAPRGRAESAGFPWERGAVEDERGDAYRPEETFEARQLARSLVSSTPLHAALALRRGDAVVCAALKGRRRDAARLSSGLFPLNVALECYDRAARGGYTPRAILAVLSAHPAAARVRKASAGTALHAALYARHDDVVVLGVLRAEPGAAAVRDRRGALPAHAALEAGASDAVLAALLDAHPDAAKVPCPFPVRVPNRRPSGVCTDGCVEQCWNQPLV